MKKISKTPSKSKTKTMIIIFTDTQFDVLKKINLQDFKYLVGFFNLENNWRLIMADKVL